MKSTAVLCVLFSASLAAASDLGATSGLRIRRSCAADAPRCRALAADHLAGAIPSPRWWHSALRKRKRKALRCFVALREGDIVGFVICRRVRANAKLVNEQNTEHTFRDVEWASAEDRGHIAMVAVAPEHRGNGVGRALIQRAERLLRRQGLHLVSLYVRESSSAVGFYERLGYATEARVERYYGHPDPEDALMLLRRLPKPAPR